MNCRLTSREVDTVGEEEAVERRPVGELRAIASAAYQPWAAMGGQPRRARRDPMTASNRRALAGHAFGLPQRTDVLALAATMGRGRRVAEDVESLPLRGRRPKQARLGRELHGRELRSRKNGGSCVGNGTNWMVVVDGQGIPLGSQPASASPAEVKLAESTLDSSFIEVKAERLILDLGYDSDSLRVRCWERGIEKICAHRRGRTRLTLQDGRPLRRYRKRWIMERAFAWLGNYRRTRRALRPRHPVLPSVFPRRPRPHHVTGLMKPLLVANPRPTPARPPAPASHPA